MTVESLITQHIDTWTSAVKTKSTTGRGSSKKLELYGVKKLRELILELAVRGKLVPQDPNDEPASVLLDRIAAEKAQLVKDKKIKKNRKQPAITQEEIYFSVPESWAYARLEDIYDVRDGTHDSPKPTSEGFPLVTSKNLSSGKLDLSDVKLISKEDHIKVIERSRVDRNDILFAMIGSIGNPVIVDTEIEFSIKNVGLFKYYNPQDSSPNYLNYFLKYAAEIMKKQSAGGVQPFVSLGKLRSFVMPTPPLAEQQRIVAKVDELMALCDQLEQQTEASIEAHQLLVSTLLNTLTNSADADELMENWARISDHFDTLFTTEESIEQLKQTILQLAVMGKLVPQDPNDEPASVLLERIAEEKAQLIKEKKIKKQKALPPIADDEKPFELPKGWEWCRYQDLCHKITDGEHSTPKRTDTGHYLLSARNVTNEGIILGDVDYVPDCEFERIRNRCDPNIGDILISCSGSIGRVALVDRDNAYSMVRSAAMIRPCKTNLIKEYLALMLRSPYLQLQMKNRSKQSAQANLFLGAISNLVGVIPPLSEQERIVSKVSELFVVCDQIKSHLKESQTIQLNLTDAIVEQAV
ncbi:restriction endonuclease subunit S [Photobacterium damselae]|uniref:restriction endonuclease subunit S n=1 Tax=Photobacterium damselae TaxID=38293 RepID=UPI001EEDFB28|nr:restriction endonuclease subunit S [Photobacterium damselae]UKA03076.1 restriction endonuclease subunit S [Photobacterium damselae subsp. damselae]